MKSFFRFIFILLIITALIAGLLGYIGVIPQISSFLGTNKPRDLGIKFTDVILDQAKNKVKVDLKTLSATDNPVESISYMGKHPVNASFSSEELTALVADRPWEYYPVSRTQIKLNKDGTAEIAGFIHSDRIPGYLIATGGSKFDLSIVMNKIKLPKGLVPFYIKGSGNVRNNAVNVDIQTLEIGRLPIPLQIITPNIKNIDTFIEERLFFVKEASVESLTLSDGKMKFTGKLPDLEGMTPEK